MEGSSIAPFAWFFMLLSMGSVTILTVYCYMRILSGSPGAGEDPPSERDLPDS